MDSSCNRSNQLIPSESCRIALDIPTSNVSSVILELFLPGEVEWTGRLLGTGNGGIDGCIKYEDIAYGLEHGFAVTGTNNGHNGTSGGAFLNNPNVITDFSWRAIHTAAEAGKILTKAFYASAPRKSYYIGCSGGGRQGIQAADLFPDDYDGILVGAPGLNFNYMSAWRASFYVITESKNSSDFIEPETWKSLIHGEVLRQCDNLDGLDDGILIDPAFCAAILRPEALLCGNNKTSNCLSPKQVQMVDKVFSPLYGTEAQMIYPPLAPGAEVQAIQRLLSGSPFPYSVDWFRYAVYADPNWDPVNWTIEDAKVAEEKNPGNARTWPNDLTALRDRGGKLLVYHGGSDQQITGFNTEVWYDYLSRSMNTRSEDQDEFLRFFRIPGMGHCSGGNGAWKIGQSGAGADGTAFEAESNVLAALVQWVEDGKKPDSIVGTKFLDDDVGKEIEFRRRHCR